ncbi:MAG: ferritin family protein [Armatimonadetes bacterium]|nr:ferritin family protein [Armatimonadota bacterium]
MEKLLEILKLAVEKEVVRKAMYEEAASKATNPLVKSTFETLAREEDKHAVFVQTYYDRQVANQGWPAPSEIGADEDFREVIKEIFKTASNQIKATGADAKAELSDVYDAAIAAELESVHFYTDALNHADDPNVRAFFEVLVEAEKLHHKLLKDTQKYLDDPSAWYFDQEQWTVEG